ncbi:MAG: ROK family protein [Bacteroidetes bacterium]|nr:ROK family protein [Bacteroidota bacterium]MCH8232758.1 ROK family protein [Bacteroidota bacterium]
MKKLALGIDIGGTNTKFGFVDEEGNEYAENSFPTNDDRSFDDFLIQLDEEIKKAEKEINFLFELIGIGIGAPNGNYLRGTIEYPTNLKWKGVTPFVEKFKNYYDVPIYMTNDANAAAMGEMIFGGAKGMKDFIVFTLGTGLGSGIVSNGQIIYGHDGFAGELGHTLVNVFGRECGCGRRGCLETYVSATGIKRTVYKLLADYLDESELRNVPFDELSAEMITNAAIRKDTIAIRAFEYTGRILGMKLADTIVHFSPEAVFLTGGLVNAGDYLLKPTRQYLYENMMPIYKKNPPKLLTSELLHKNVAVLGASSMVWNEASR